jgi:mono/diheme cytochrome c family protein
MNSNSRSTRLGTPRALPLLAVFALAIMPMIQGCGSSHSDASATGAGSNATATPPASSDGSVIPVDSSAHLPAPVEPGLALGEHVFKQRCVLCHGPQGRGDGPGSKGLKPNPPRNFHDAAYMKSRTDEQLLVSIHNGKNAMPPWKAILSEVEMKSVLMYVRGFASQP